MELRFPRFAFATQEHVVRFEIHEKKISTVAQERFTIKNMANTQMFIDYLHTTTLISFLSHLTFPYFDGLVALSDLNLAGFHCRQRDMMICYHWKRSKLPLTTLSF